MKHFCYFNLHKKVFSVRNEKTKKVEHHSRFVVMDNCTLKVSQAGRERVLREKRKNVHAGIQGELVSTEDILFNEQDYIELTYNPYKYHSFVVKSSEVPVKTADRIILKDKRIFAKRVFI